MEFLLGLICAVWGLFMGWAIFSNTDQSLIEEFKNPTCVERTVGKDKIKKCYEIKEVKELENYDRK